MDNISKLFLRDRLEKHKSLAAIMPLGKTAVFSRFVDTQLLNANALTQEHWPQTMFEFMLENMQLSKFMGQDSGNIIQLNKDLSKKAGDKVTFELDMPLSNAGIGDDGTLEGNEESMSFYNFPVTIHERGNAVKSAGKMTDKRTAIDIRKKAVYALSRWAAEQLDNDCLYALSGLGNQNTYVGEGTSSIETVNEKAPSTNRIFYGGQTTAGVLSSVDSDSEIGDDAADDYANYLFGTLVISLIKRKAQLAYPKFRPINVGGKWYYVMFIHPLQTKAIRAETGAAGWAQIQRNANVRGINNPLFTREGAGRERMFDGAIGVWDDVILYEYERIQTRVGGEVFDSGDTVNADYITSGTCRICRALLCGAQAGVVAWGQPWKRYEKNFDYYRKPGTATDGLYGVSKTQFRDPGANQSTNTAQDDFAVFAVDTAAQDD